MHKMAEELVDVTAMGLGVYISQAAPFRAVAPSPMVRGLLMMAVGYLITRTSKNDLVKTAGRGLAAGGLIDIFVEEFKIGKGALDGLDADGLPVLPPNEVMI